MSDLFQLPELSEPKQIIKRDASVPDISVFNEDQHRAFKGITGILSGNSGGMVVLSGFAGSGKTFLVSRIIEARLSENWSKRIAFAATTNKAVKVAINGTEFTHPNLEFCTVHKLLGLKEVLQRDGTIDFYPDKYSKPSIGEFDTVFIDEASMLNARIFGYLLDYAEYVKIIFVGDSAQIVPVKETESIVFNARKQQEHNMAAFALTQIVRQAENNPIIKVTTAIRNNLSVASYIGDKFGYRDQLYDGDKGVYFLGRRASKPREYFDSLLKHVFTSGNFAANADFAKVLAYRNDTVNTLNAGIRRMLFGKGKLRRLEPGEKIVTKSPVFDEDGQMILIPNATELEVVSFERKGESINNGQYEIFYYDTVVKYLDMQNNVRSEFIRVPTDLGQIALTRCLNELAEIAGGYKPGTFAFSNAWGDFYRLKKSFAEISYNYALTFHLSQGSTFSNTIILERDAFVCHRTVERNKLLYTGCTRPKDRLFIL